MHIVISNPTPNRVHWYSITFAVPFGRGSTALTTSAGAGVAQVEEHDATDPGLVPAATWDNRSGVVTVTCGQLAVFKPGGSMVLVLDRFPVSSTPGAVLIKVTEDLSGATDSNTTLSLLKRAPIGPRNFRPEKSLIDTGGKVTLLWDGPDTLEYSIQHPDGNEVRVPGRRGSTWTWSPPASKAPKHAATYTLIARLPGTQQPLYYLTTAVQLSSPEYKQVTATEGVETPWVQGTTQKGRISFTARGAKFSVGAGAPGTVETHKAELDELYVARGAAVDGALVVKGRVDAQDELHVVRGAAVDGALTVGGKVEARSEVHVAGDAAVDGAFAVGGKVEARGELSVARDAAIGGNLTVKGKLELDELLVFRKAAVGGDLSVNGRADILGGLLSAGKTVVGDDLTVNGAVDAGGELRAAGKAVVGGDLDVSGESAFAGKVNANGHLSVRNGGAWILHTNDDLISVNGGLRVQGDSLFIGKVNANGRLSVRNGTDWLMHVNDDQVAIQGNMRVHGAFRSDS
ncbi:hypothetical protein [Streptomyces marincola]|uniref:hypothetical protein n=1 Tax=Streptomyces marincola TaxID=2878388 RepID=UPI001CF5E974|nr:hypothetical protein [Streptomyces marincola]UCM91179.1 hypothetical protein LC193_26350 [Streptomyces marincola]